jgi:hypothetical protein
LPYLLKNLHIELKRFFWFLFYKHYQGEGCRFRASSTTDCICVFMLMVASLVFSDKSIAASVALITNFRAVFLASGDSANNIAAAAKANPKGDLNILVPPVQVDR